MTSASLPWPGLFEIASPSTWDAQSPASAAQIAIEDASPLSEQYAIASPSASAGETISWEKPCEAMFEYLASHKPRKLLSLIESGELTDAQLTFAAEWAGRTAERERAQLILFRLLRHPSSLVREEAIYGLQQLGESNSIREALLERTRSDREPSPGVRAAALDALEGLSA